MNKKALATLAMVSLTFVSLLGACVGSIAWFVTTTSVKGVNGDATTDAAYFAGGSGASNNPYIIKTKRHLYNLAWLQDMGKFNVDKDSDGKIDQIYFKLDDSLKTTGLNMENMVIPPIGTEQYPFVGQFDGNNVTISNFKISNDFDHYNGNHPTNVSSFGTGVNDVNQPRVVGFFGVIGEKDNTLSYSSSVNIVKDFVLNNFTVETVASNTLIGLAIGYANGTSTNVAIDNATMDIDDGCDLLGDPGMTNFSDFGLVGYATDDYKVEESDNSYDVYAPVDVDSSIYENDFGGSLPMRDIYNYAVNARPGGNYKKRIYTDTNGHTVATFGYRNNDSAVVQMYGLNVNGSGNAAEGPFDTFIPFAFDNNGGVGSIGASNTGYITASCVYQDRSRNYFSNSPFRITGAANYHTVNKAIGLSVGGEGGLDNTNVSVTESTTMYVITKNRMSNANTNIPSNLDGYTMIDWSGSGVLTGKNPYLSTGTSKFYKTVHNSLYNNRMTIEDLAFDQSAFKSSYSTMRTTLSRSENVAGFRYMTLKGATYDSSPRLANKFTIDYAYVSKKTYTSYDLIGNGVNFSLGMTGSVRFYGFQHYTGSDDVDHNSNNLEGGSYDARDFGFGRIYKVERSTSGSTSSITGLNQISLIYRDNTKQPKDPNEFVYVYTTDNSDPYSNNARYELYFNTSWINGSSEMYSRLPHTLYYYEIPLNKGDYVLGCPEIQSGSSLACGGWILYLDVAANNASGGTYWQDKYKNNSDVSSYVVGIDFVVIEDFDSENNPVSGGESASIKIDSTVDGDMLFVYTYTANPGNLEGGPPTTLTVSAPDHGAPLCSYSAENVTVVGANRDTVVGGYSLIEQIIQNTSTELDIKDGPYTGNYNAQGTLISGTAERWAGQSTIICGLSATMPGTVRFERIYISLTEMIFRFNTSRASAETFSLSVGTVANGYTIHLNDANGTVLVSNTTYSVTANPAN